MRPIHRRDGRHGLHGQPIPLFVGGLYLTLRYTCVYTLQGGAIADGQPLWDATVVADLRRLFSGLFTPQTLTRIPKPLSDASLVVDLWLQTYDDSFFFWSLPGLPAARMQLSVPRLCPKHTPTTPPTTHRETHTLPHTHARTRARAHTHVRRQVNAYGVFGSITKKRFELTLEFKHATAATMVRAGDADGRDAPWQELEFKCKPDRLQKLPCFVTPYQYHLDWETWIHVTALGEHQVHAIRGSGRSGG